jgi:NADH-quinone oxidoreductase subunit J
MVIADLLFYLFAGLLLISSVIVISARNAVHSVLFLILAFFNAAGLFVLMGAEYVAMLLVIVYVGAVAVLFLFVVMMLDVTSVKLKGAWAKRHIPVGLIVGGVLIAELIFVFKAWVSAENAINNRLFPSASRDTVGTAQALGEILYTHYIYAFQVSGLILLVAMIGAITLCFRTRSGVRRQKALDQVTRTVEQSMEIVRPESGKGVTL